MATTIHLEGWVNSIKTFSWGTALSVSVSNRIKNDATGEWETASRDYYDVILGEGMTADGITEDMEVAVDGTFKVGKTFPKKDGTTGVELKVRATSIAPLVRAPRTTDDEAPF
jgi:hypothetical protein